MPILDFFAELFSNRLLLSAVAAWFVAQTLKTIIYAVMNKTFDWRRIFGAGGMPSSHAATVCALTVSSAITLGPASFEFTISFILAVLVMHDARGVRRETGIQAEVLNKMLDRLQEGSENIFQDIELKELVGHTPFQVLMGAIIGIIVGIIIH